MNVYFVFDDGTLVTPPLTGTILEGVTRDAMLTMAAEHGHDGRGTADRHRRVAPGVASGAITEVFACGTAAVVTPLGRCLARGRAHDAARTPVTETCATRWSTSSTAGPDPHGWMHRVP